VPENVRGEVALATLIRDRVRDFQNALLSRASRRRSCRFRFMQSAVAIFWSHFTKGAPVFKNLVWPLGLPNQKLFSSTALTFAVHGAVQSSFVFIRGCNELLRVGLNPHGPHASARVTSYGVTLLAA
jgi:hypothetical protein